MGLTKDEVVNALTQHMRDSGVTREEQREATELRVWVRTWNDDAEELQELDDDLRGQTSHIVWAVSALHKQGRRSASSGGGREARRTYAIIGLQKKLKDFTASSIITFEELSGHIKRLWPFYQNVEFDVYTEDAVQASNRKRSAGRRPLDGNQLNQDRWLQHLISLVATAEVRVVVKAKGKPFSEYNGMSDDLLRKLVYDHTKLTLESGKPLLDHAEFEPPPDFANGDQLLHWGVTPPLGPDVLAAQHSTAVGANSTQHANCPVCCTPFKTAAPGQDAQAAGCSIGGAPPPLDSRQQVPQRGAQQPVKFKHLITILAHAMICLVQSLASDRPSDEVVHRGFIDLVLSGALMLAKSLKPRSSGQRPYMKAEHALAGPMAWGKIDYLLVYRALGIMVVEAKPGNLDDAWGQAFMELCAMHHALVHQLRSLSSGNDKKRTACEAFLTQQLKIYMLICNANSYRLVLYKPQTGLWWSAVSELSFSARTSVEQLAPGLEDLIRTLAYALTCQMDWLDKGLDEFDELAIPPPEVSGEDVENATKDYKQNMAQQQAQQEDDLDADTAAQRLEGL